MISAFDSADQAIEKTILDMCKKLSRIHPDNSEYVTIVDSIAKLRASLNATVIESK